MSRGLYIHIPFCKSKCKYCDFYSLSDMSLYDDFVKALISQIGMYKNKNIEVDTVFFGGGTPSVIKENDFYNIAKAINDAFVISKNAEITVEVNPGTNEIFDRITACKSFANRLSLGAQSFCDNELSALGRIHKSEDIIKTVEFANKTGFDNISLDIMYGIPEQTRKSLDYSLDKALSLPISHISAYGLMIEEKTVFGVKMKKGENLFLPSPDVEREMYFDICDKLKNSGFSHYEISNFAKPGFESRHNLKYWHCDEYIGIGPASHSYFEGKRYSSKNSVGSFIEKGDTMENISLLDNDDLAEEYIMLGLRLCEGIDLDKVKAFGYGITDEYLDFEFDLIKAGLITKKGNNISLTEKGFYVSNTVIEKILDKLLII